MDEDNKSDDVELSEHPSEFESSKNVALSSEMELLLAAESACTSVNLLLSDKFDEALAGVQECYNQSVYHMFRYAFLHFTQATLTMEPSDIQCALEVLNKTSEACNAKRHRWTFSDNAITKLFSHTNYDSYTEEEVHAELVYAELILGKAMLTYIQDDNFLNFVRGGIRLRSAFFNLKECHVILQQRNWINCALKEHFASGVFLGLGFFNLTLSSFPKRILKLLEFIGFSGEKEKALEMLEAGHAMPNALRGPLCSVVNILHHFISKHHFGNDLKEWDLDYIGKLLAPLQEKYPKSTLISYYSGKLEEFRGDIRNAISILKTSLCDSENCVKFRQLTYWDLFFSYVIVGEYRSAFNCATILLKGSNWSKSLYSYMKAVTLFVCENDIVEDERQEMIELFKQVPGLRKRLAGKSVPPEKYFAFRAERFVAQNNWLPLPTFEMLYVFNYLFILKLNTELLNPILAVINCVLADFNEDRHKDNPFYMDNYCLALLLKGVCLNYAGNEMKAKMFFHEICDNREEIKEDHYIVSCAFLELGLIYQNIGKYDKAIECLESAKENVSFFAEYRIHNALEEMELITKGI